MAEKVWKDYREESKKLYGANREQGEGISNDQLQAGSLMRIADAMEIRNTDIVATIAEKNRLGRELSKVMAELKESQDREKRTETYWRNAQTYGMRMERSRNGLRGYIAKLKKRLR